MIIPETIGNIGLPVNTPAVGAYADYAYFIREGEIVGIGIVHHAGNHRVRVEPFNNAARALFKNHYMINDPSMEILKDYRFPTYWATTGDPTNTFSDEPDGQHMGTTVVGTREYNDRDLPTVALMRINFK